MSDIWPKAFQAVMLECSIEHLDVQRSFINFYNELAYHNISLEFERFKKFYLFVAHLRPFQKLHIL